MHNWKLTFIGIVSLLALLACGESANIGSTVASGSTDTPVSTTLPKVPTATPTNAHMTFDPNKADGPPTIGATIQNFVKQYGQPISYGIGDGGSPNFYADTDQTIMLGTHIDANGIVTYVAALGAESWSTWSKEQTLKYCLQFLPSDAIKFNNIDIDSSNSLSDFHSHAGQIAIRTVAGINCVMTTGS